MGRDSAFPDNFIRTLENIMSLGREKLISMQNELAHGLNNLSRIYPEGSARQSSYQGEIKMIEEALNALDEKANELYNYSLIKNSREDIAERFYTEIRASIKYETDFSQRQFALEKLAEAERLAKELESMGYPITQKDLDEAQSRIKDREIRMKYGARRMEKMGVCDKCRATIFANSIYCAYCGNLVGNLPERLVFVSYGSSDKKYVEEITRKLKAGNIDAWFDEWEILPGESIQEEINKAIKNCKVFLFFASKDTLKREWPKEELKAAIARRMESVKLIIIPLLIDNCEDDLPKLLKDTKYIPFHDGEKKIKLDTEEGEQLLNNLKNAILGNKYQPIL